MSEFNLQGNYFKIPNSDEIILCVSDIKGIKYASFKYENNENIIKIRKDIVIEDYLWLEMMTISIG
jgi:hypothetical protein